MTFIVTHKYHSPCGILTIGDYNGKLCLCDWTEIPQRYIIQRISNSLNCKYSMGITPLISSVISQLDEYFEGNRIAFNLPLLLIGTDFQHKVWNELIKIPYGTTTSYSQLAHKIGNPNATRAVANACHANAMSIIIPCHRVIGTNGKLCGYAGGVSSKTHLLLLEAIRHTF